VRREGTHPTTPNPAFDAEGVVVAALPTESSAVDVGLRGETVYYYGLFPYATTGPGNTIVISDPAEQIDRLNRASAMATSSLGIADKMYALLPLIYHRYDTVPLRGATAEIGAEDRTRGALRRFLELPGGQLDQVYSCARALLHAVDADRVDGNLLPLLADWIGWRTDYSLEIEDQRNEVRNAPQIYKAIGGISVIEATVKRISGEESRTKEFVHNVAATNRQPRLNLWQRVRSTGTWAPAQLLSLDASFDGRPSTVRDGEGLRWLFYHAEENGRCTIRSKTFGDDGWTPSELVSGVSGLTLKDPSAAVQGTRLVLFWSAYEPGRNRWTIQSRSRSGAAWSPVETFVPPEGNSETQRRQPVATADDNAGMWLFWLEEVGGEWLLKYNRHDGTTWQVNPSPTFAADAGQPPAVLGDVYAVFHPTDVGQRLWLFWARQDVTSSEQTRWTVAYRVKAGLDPESLADWSQIRTLPKTVGNDDHDREPSARVQVGGDLEVCWSSHRGGRWSIWQSVLDRSTHAWATPEDLGTPPYAMRAPLMFASGTNVILVFRSTESLTYSSALYGATHTVDFRYSGSITVDTRNAALIALRGKFEDFGTYLYDSGTDGVRTDDDWYARDTVGVYVPADMDDHTISRLHQVLREFMPATDRAVLVKDA